MNTVTYAGQGARLEGSRRSLGGRLAGLLTRFRQARRARQDFEALRGASDHLLADIGLTRSQLEIALAAPFWVNPSERLKVERRRGGR